MRCKICYNPHKNTASHNQWIEFQVCRMCSDILEHFSWNGNRLKEYWEVKNAVL